MEPVGGGYDFRPALRGEDPRLPWPTLRSTPSSRPTTFAGSIPTSSTSRSPVGSATPSSRSPERPGCSSAATRARRRSRSSPRSPRARTIAGADVVDLGLASTDLCYFAAGRPRRARGDVHRQPQPGPVQRHQAVPGRRRARSARTPASPRSRRWSPAGSSSGPKIPGRVERARPAAGVRRARALVRRPRRARAAAGRRRHRQRRGRPRRARGVRRAAVRAHHPLRRARRHLPEPPGRSDPAPRTSRTSSARCSTPTPQSGSRSTATPTASCSSTTRRSRSRAPPPPRSSPRRSSAATPARRSCTT